MRDITVSYARKLVSAGKPVYAVLADGTRERLIRVGTHYSYGFQGKKWANASLIFSL